jgi:hypothetical protein
LEPEDGDIYAVIPPFPETEGLVDVLEVSGVPVEVNCACVPYSLLKWTRERMAIAKAIAAVLT